MAIGKCSVQLTANEGQSRGAKNSHGWRIFDVIGQRRTVKTHCLEIVVMHERAKRAGKLPICELHVLLIIKVLRNPRLLDRSEQGDLERHLAAIVNVAIILDELD